jgi:uncharacterized protein (TIGR02145 family)
MKRYSKFSVSVLFFSNFIILLNFCKKDSLPLPILTTANVTEVSLTTALSGGNITDDGGTNVTVRGVCWGTAADPTISDSKTIDGTGYGNFTSQLTCLRENTLYFIRAYATNSTGTGYGNEIWFSTNAASVFNINLTYGTLTDTEEIVYRSIKIGAQTWMAENLKTSRYRNGDLIGTTSVPSLNTTAEVGPKYQWAYDGNENNVEVYGRLYTWYTITDNRNVCPSGWHVPNDDEWATLEDYLGGWKNAGGKLKESGTTHWQVPNEGANNESGFTALPGGMRFENGTFTYLGTVGLWWSSDEANPNSPSAMSWSVQYNSSVLSMGWTGDANGRGLSVRCIKD